jgi:hypothetical protein
MLAFMKRDDTTTVIRKPVTTARGGVSGGAILTGVVVSFGCMFLLSAVVAGVLATIGVGADELSDAPVEVGVGAGIVLVATQLVAYLWGGYTAGRMGRGAGVANGVLVPLVALLVAVVVGAIAAVMGTTANLNLPFQAYRLPVQDDYLVDWGIGIGIASLVAMFLGGAIGGALGTRWHSRLERAAIEGDGSSDSTQTRTSPTTD